VANITFADFSYYQAIVVQHNMMGKRSGREKLRFKSGYSIKTLAFRRKYHIVCRRTRTKNIIKRFQKYGTNIKPKHCK